MPERMRRRRSTISYAPCAQSPRRSRRAWDFPATARSHDALPALPRAYKRPPSTPQRSTPPQPLSPATLSSSLPWNRPISGEHRRSDSKDSGHRWRSRRCEVEEPTRRCRSASSPPSPTVALFFFATLVSSWPIPRWTTMVRHWIWIQR
jgi:hypothetical protein